MPEFQNPETPIDQQYDPRFGQAYAENLERTILRGLNVRNTPNYNADNIGDLSAMIAIGAYVTRSIIGKLFRNSKTKDNRNKNNKTRKNIREKTAKQVREELQINQPEFIRLPQITETQPNRILQYIPVQPNYRVAEFYSNPSYGEYFQRDTEVNTEDNIPDLIDMNEPGEIIRDYIKTESSDEILEEPIQEEPIQEQPIQEQPLSYEENFESDEENFESYEDICRNIETPEVVESGSDIFNYLLKFICFAYNNHIPEDILVLIKKYTENNRIVIDTLLHGSPNSLAILGDIYQNEYYDIEERMSQSRIVLDELFNTINEIIDINNNNNNNNNNQYSIRRSDSIESNEEEEEEEEEYVSEYSKNNLR